MEHATNTESLERDPEVCALVQDLLPLYLEDEVSSDSRARIVAHLNECAHCAGFLRGAQSTRAQFAREREREGGRESPSDAQVRSVGLRAIRLVIGAGGLLVSVLLLLALAVYALDRPFSSLLLQIGTGAMVHGVFLFVCVGIISMLSVRLLRQRTNPGLDMVALVGLVLGSAGLLVPFVEPIYRIIGMVMIALAGLHLWLERQNTLTRWTVQKGSAISGILVAIFGLTFLLAITLPHIREASFGDLSGNSYAGAQTAPTAVPPDAGTLATPVWTPTSTALANVYPAPRLPAMTPSPTIVPTALP